MANLRAKIANLDSRLVSGEDSLDVQLEAIKAGRELQKLPKPSIDVSIKGRDLLRKIVYEPKEVNQLSGHQSFVNDVVLSPNGEYLASASWDNTVKLWSAKGELIATLSGHQDAVTDVEFSADGKYLASASDDKTVKLWNLQGELLHTLQGHQNFVTDVEFSPDGEYLASASGDNTVKLWNFNLEELLTHACNQVRNYLINNPDVKEEELDLCHYPFR